MGTALRISKCFGPIYSRIQEQLCRLPTSIFLKQTQVKEILLFCSGDYTATGFGTLRFSYLTFYSVVPNPLPEWSIFAFGGDPDRSPTLVGV